MRECLKFYIGGAWVDPIELQTLEVINPATEQVAGRVAVGASADVDAAVRAARAAFPSWSQTSREERIELLERIVGELKRRLPEIGRAITEEMGAPASLALQAQASVGVVHLNAAKRALKNYVFEERRGTTLLCKEPIGVCGLITPWNWPINQIVTKVAPALATGCTMVLKPSELAPFSAYLWTEVLDAAGVPAGVFNLVNGDGPGVGAAISRHSGIDMVSFTGSTRAGIDVARNAAPSVKRVCQELGGKSPNIVLDDDSFADAVKKGVRAVMLNSGQSCNAPTRLLVPSARMAEGMEIARKTAERLTVGDPTTDVALGPVVSAAQWNKVQGFIQQGIDCGATLAAGGLGKPDGLDRGFFVKPTVFGNVTNEMPIAREEIFGPVLVILGYDGVEEAVRIANDTDYGIAAYVSGSRRDEVRKIAARLRAGQVVVNSALPDPSAPFGGYKQSGNGREWGDHAFHDYLEVKAVLGYEDAPAA